jgi:hypothetical protein
MAPTEARATEAPVWPSCTRVNIDRDTIRVWVDPGTLHEVRRVRVGDVVLRRRDDGVWYGDVDRPHRRYKNELLISFSARDAMWVKCKQVLR